MNALMDTMKSKEEENKARQAIDRATGGKLAGAPKLTDQSTWLATGVKKKQEAANYELTLALMCAGVAPHVMDCPEVKAALKTVALVGSGYNPPGSKAVGGRLAKLVRQTVGEKVREASARAELGGVTLCSDGITSEKNTPIINVVLVCGGLGLNLNLARSRSTLFAAWLTAHTPCQTSLSTPRMRRVRSRSRVTRRR
jgi:hypothetical protein